MDSHEILQLYENTLAQQGFMRRKEEHTAQTNERQLCHVRWMIDEITQKAKKESWPDAKIARHVGFIQGVLWSSRLFSLPALADQAACLYHPVPDPTPAT